MKKQIATAAVIGALLALGCLLWEQQSVASMGNHGGGARALRANPSPFARHMRYSNV